MTSVPPCWARRTSTGPANWSSALRSVNGAQGGALSSSSCSCLGSAGKAAKTDFLWPAALCSAAGGACDALGVIAPEAQHSLVLPLLEGFQRAKELQNCTCKKGGLVPFSQGWGPEVEWGE